MNLHNHPEIFVELLNNTARDIGIPEPFIEKDYWLSTVLRELSRSPHASLAVFKGGTSLSKAYDIIERFSEDIDLALIVENLSGNQVKSRIDSISKAITRHLPEVKIEKITSKGSRFRRTVHQYHTISKAPLPATQIRLQLILEINAFANPFPYTVISLESLITSYLQRLGRDDLIAQFELEAFPLQVLKPTRTLSEKVLALARASYHPERLIQLQDKIRHTYDVYFLMQQEEMQAFVAGSDFFPTLHAVQADDAKNSEFQGEWADQPLASAWIYQDDPELWEQLDVVYTGPFKNMVYGPLPDLTDVRQVFRQLAKRLQDFDTSTRD